jgi:hypothetical protein
LTEKGKSTILNWRIHLKVDDILIGLLWKKNQFQTFTRETIEKWANDPLVNLLLLHSTTSIRIKLDEFL